MTWETHAACQGADERLFFPEGRTVAARATTTRALAYCHICPVRAECLADEIDAMAGGAMTFGIRGGTTSRQRHTILTQRWRYR